MDSLLVFDKQNEKQSWIFSGMLQLRPMLLANFRDIKSEKHFPLSKFSDIAINQYC